MSRLSLWAWTGVGIVIAELFNAQFDFKAVFTALYWSGWCLLLHWYWNSEYSFLRKRNAS